MVTFEGKNLGEKVEDKIWGKILVQKYWLQKMNTSFVHQSKAQDLCLLLLLLLFVTTTTTTTTTIWG